MYTYTWKKYLPVIRLLLKRSADAEQVLNLNRTDFERTTKLRKPSCSFSMDLVKGKLRLLNPPVPAKDLLEILLQDKAAETLLRKEHYTISLNSDFQLTIKNLTPPAEAGTKDSDQPSEEDSEKDKSYAIDGV
jgi:hypothetical protein